MLSGYGLPLLPEKSAVTVEEASFAANQLGYPVVLKLCGDAIAHKTERGLVRLRLSNSNDVARAADELLAAATPDDGPVSLLVAPMVSGSRELIVGALRDPVFGATLMLGVGGVMAEAGSGSRARMVFRTYYGAAPAAGSATLLRSKP